jgi:hypothetical protein
MDWIWVFGLEVLEMVGVVDPLNDGEGEKDGGRTPCVSPSRIVCFAVEIVDFSFCVDEAV